jgi:hypothetical protein
MTHKNSETTVQHSPCCEDQQKCCSEKDTNDCCKEVVAESCCK